MCVFLVFVLSLCLVFVYGVIPTLVFIYENHIDGRFRSMATIAPAIPNTTLHIR